MGSLKYLPHKHKDLAPELSKLGTFFPDESLIYSSLNKCKDIKVIILGMDPYPTPGNANGLAFSVNKGMGIPGSLANIFTEMGIDRANGDLSDWAAQGVLLYNVGLTIPTTNGSGTGNSGKHIPIWSKFSSAVLRDISASYEGLVWVLFGRSAQKYQRFIDSKKHVIIKTSHPSNQSSHKPLGGSDPCPAFAVSNVFATINTYLISKKKAPIIWAKPLDTEESSTSSSSIPKVVKLKEFKTYSAMLTATHEVMIQPDGLITIVRDEIKNCKANVIIQINVLEMSYRYPALFDPLSKVRNMFISHTAEAKYSPSTDVSELASKILSNRLKVISDYKMIKSVAFVYKPEYRTDNKAQWLLINTVLQDWAKQNLWLDVYVFVDPSIDIV